MTLQQASMFTINVGKQILRTETNDGRFEGFCREIISILEGGAYIMSTSASWDMGRDGVGFGRASGIYVCVSLRDDVDGKALSDIERITSTTSNIKKIYFCSSHELSEHKRNSIEEQLGNEVDFAFPISVCGNAQLIEVAAQNENVLTRYYGAEISDIKSAINAPLDQENERRGLRLALMSIGEDSASIRAELYESAILESLTLHGPLTLSAAANKISERLRLMRSLAKEALIAPINEAVSKGLIELKNGLYHLTDAGSEKTNQNVDTATAELLSGRAVIRNEIEEAIGGKLAEDHFNKLWGVFQSKMVTYCISRGETFVAEVGRLIGDASRKSNTEPFQPFSFVEEIADAVAATSSSPQQRLELSQAIKDIFHQRTGPATEWLVRLCMSFMAACSLGMEFACGSAIESLLKKTSLVLDSDVALSLLGEGEADHDGVIAIVSRWNEFGGKILIGEPVLEEVAYHASIAHLDYTQVRDWIPGTEVERRGIISNVFVRSFAEMLARGEVKSHQWRSYIKSVEGSTPYDWISIFQILSAEYSIEKLPPRSSEQEDLEGRVRQHLINEKQGNALTDVAVRNLQDKARRDAQLYAALISYLRGIRRSDPSATCMLVSSAHKIASAEEKFREAAEPELVVSISTVLHLLSLVPNVKLGASAMRAFLFDERPMGFSSDFERTLMRMLKASDEIFLPTAKRATLMKSLREKMMQDAKSRGSRQRPEVLEQAAFEPQNQAGTIQMLKAALDAVAVDTKMAEENIALRKRVAELEALALQRRTQPANQSRKNRRTR